MNPYCTEAGSLEVLSCLDKKKCGYCKSGKETYRKGSFVVKDFCVDAYYAAYPYFLALLYDARFGAGQSKNVIVNCPNAASPTLIGVGFKYKKFNFLLHLIERFFRMLRMPKDVIDKTMVLEVKSDNPSCKLKKGLRRKVKVPDIRELCPASFFSFYPLLYVSSRLSSENQPHAQARDLTFLCPDPKTNISYKVVDGGGGREGLVVATVRDDACNLDLSRFEVTKLGEEACHAWPWHQKSVTVDKMLPGNICPFLFNVSIPYVLTLTNSGYFKWSPDKNKVWAQCPNPQGCVEFEVSRDPVLLSVRINRVRKVCPRRHQKGQWYDLDSFHMASMHLFTRIFPALLLLSQETKEYEEGLTIVCPLEEKVHSYLLKRKTS